jgi:hypothetical protein
VKDADLAEALSLPADDTAGQLEPVDTVEPFDVGRLVRVIVVAGLIIGAAAAVLIVWEAWDENRRIAASTITATATDAPTPSTSDTPSSETPVADTGPLPAQPPGADPADLPATS